MKAGPVQHISVLLPQVVTGLDPKPGDIILDGTLGFGGHAEAILGQMAGQGRYLGIDQDTEALTSSQARLQAFSQVSFHHHTFSEFAQVLQELGLSAVDKILLDLGVSSWQIDQASRGFSFQKDGPLDMRMDSTASQIATAADVINTASKDALITIFETYGELPQAYKLADTLCAWRQTKPFETTEDLTFAIKKSYYFNNNRSKMMKAFAQVFQALRIEVNQELAQLTRFLETFPDHLAVGGRIAIITFHSLEDRMVKHFFKARPEQFKPVGKKVIQPTYADTVENPRCRSAKLRVLEKI